MYFEARRLPDGSIEAPMRAEDPDTGLIGDGVAVLRPGDPMYAEWDKWAKAQEKRAQEP